LSHRRLSLRVLLSLFATVLLAGASLPAFGGDITNASLEIQGIGLSVVTQDPPVTTAIDVPTTVQTKFGGRENDAALAIEGLLAVGDLTGPGLETPLELSTAPGHKFQIPGLSREGVYTLQNVRLMKGRELLQYATPSSATIIVADLFKTTVEVRQLSPEEIRARGIVIDARNYEVYEYTLSFILRGETVKIPFPVIIDPRTRAVQMMPIIDPYRLPGIGTIGVGRWTPPDVIPVVFENDELPPDERPTPKPPVEPGEKLYVRPPIPAAIVIPNSLMVMHQFFAVVLNVQNGAPNGSTARLENLSARIKIPSQLRSAGTKPPVAYGQAVPIVDKVNGLTILVAQARGEAEWNVEALKPGTHTIEIELKGTLKENGQADVPLVARPRASVVVHDARFNIAFSHPDVVRKGIEYTTYSFVTNTSPTTQTIRLGNSVPPCATAGNANVCRIDGGLSDEITIPSGETRTVEYRLRSGVTGKVFATAAHIDSDNAIATAQLHMGVGDNGIPLSPATLVMPHYSQFVNETLVSEYLELLGLGYSLATAPVTSVTAKLPRVIKSDVYRRAVDIAQAGQIVFLANGAEGAEFGAIAGLSVDLLGNQAELSQWDALRRQQKYGRGASAAVTRELERVGLRNATTFETFTDNFGKALSHRDPYVAALVHGNAVSGVARPYALSIRGASSGRRIDVPNEAESAWVRDLPYAELSTINAPEIGRTGELALVGRWTTEDLEVVVTPSVTGPFRLELLYPNATDGSTMRAHFELNGAAGEPLRVPISRGATSLNALMTNGGFAQTAQSNAVPLEQLRVIGMRQDLYLDENGHKVSVLFNRPVAPGVPNDQLRTKFHGEIDFNKDGVVWMDQPRPISGAALQGSGRVIDLTFDHVLTTNAAYTVEIDPLLDPRLNVPAPFAGEFVPKIDNDRPAGIIYGKFVRGDNTPLADHEVILFSGIFNPETGGAIFEEFENPRRRVPVNPYLQPPQIANTRADGSYLFEFVRRDMEAGFGGDFRLWGVADGLTKYTYVNGAVRLPGRVHPVTLQLLGRGSAEGIVRYDNGEIAKKVNVTVGSTAFEGVRSAVTNDSGYYRVEDLPVGPLAFTATDSHGNIGFAAGEIATPGELELQDISIYRQPVPKNGSVHGTVRRSDTNQPVMGANVGVFNNGYPIGVVQTDSDGHYTFDKVPAGFISVVAAEWTISRKSANTDFDLKGDETRQVDFVLSVAPNEQLATITGVVLKEDPLFPGNAAKYQKVANALVKVYGMRIVNTDAEGRFEIVNVPLDRSGYEIGAHDPVSRRTERTQIPQLTVAGPNHIPILLRGLGKGKIRAKLLDARGLPVNGCEMLVKSGGAYYPMSGVGDGVYELDKLDVGGDYSVRTGTPPAQYGDQEVVSGTVRVAFDGQVVSVSLRLPGQGQVHARVKGISIPSDGSEPILTPLISDVTLVYSYFNSATLQTEQKEISLSTSNNGLPGAAIFPNIPAMRQYKVNSDHPLGHDSASGRLAFEGDLADHTLLLSNLAHVTGTVYGIDGTTPVPNAQVRLEDGRQDQGIVTTGLDGKYEFRNVAPGALYKITAESTQAGIFRTGQREGKLPGNGGLVNVPVTLLERGQIEGKIVYKAYKVYDPLHPENNVADTTPNDPSDNAPVPMARIYMRELDFPRRDLGTPTQPLNADLAGRFAIDNVFVGRLRATAWAVDNPDLRGDWTATLTREGELLTPYITIGGDGTGALVARVTNPNAQNAPVENAEVQLFRGGLFDFASTNVNGEVRFEQLPVGNYVVVAYSKALGKSGRHTGTITVTTDQVAEARIMLTFSGQVTGRLTDPENANQAVPGSHVTISMAEGFQQRFTTTAAGEYLFEGVREGSFTLDAKDTASNRRAVRTGLLSAADPAPVVNLELERTETLHLSVYLPDDFGNNSGVLAGPVEVAVSQRSGEFYRALQGNPIQMPKLFLNERYDIGIQELGGERRRLETFGSFPKGNATNPIKLHYPAYGALEVFVKRNNAAVSDARVAVRVSRYDTRVFYSDSIGHVFVPGLPLKGTYSITVTTLDGSSGSASLQVLQTSVVASTTIEVGSRATVTGKVTAEAGGPSALTPVVINFSGGQLFGTTDEQGSFTFAGVATTPGASAVTLTYYGPDGSTIGARQSFPLGNEWAGREYIAPTVKLDATPPQLVDIVPEQGANTVPPDTQLKFVFSEKIDASTVHNGHFVLQPADGSQAVTATFSSAAGANGTWVVTMVPPSPPAGQQFPLKSNTLYRLTVSQFVRDMTGHALGTNRGLTFTTADYVEPRVIGTVPEAGTPIPEQITYDFRFNEPLDPAPFEPGGTGFFELARMSGPEANATVVELVAGDAYIDPFTGISLYFAPSVNTKPNSFYRVRFSGVRDLQGNVVPEQTYRLASYDTFKPFVILTSPVPDGAALVSGLTYKLTPDVRNATADGTPAQDVERVEYFRVENGVETFIKAVKKAPFAYEFVAPDAPVAGLALTFRAKAFDTSVNESAMAQLDLTVRPNQPPTVAVALDRTTAVYAGERVNATVTTTDEVLQVNVQLDVKATRTDGTQYRIVEPREVKRTKLSDPWPTVTIPVDLPINLQGGTPVTFTGIATDMSGLTSNQTASLTLAVDDVKPVIVATTPDPGSEYSFGGSYRLSANVTDIGTGVSHVVFNVNGTSYTVQRTAAVVNGTGGTFTSPPVTVTAHSVNTTVPVTVTAFDFSGNSEVKTFDVVYLSIDDPTVPTGEWLCPVSGAMLPASTNNLSLKLRFRATDDISVTSVKFRLPGSETLVTPVLENGNEYAATVTINTPSADTNDYFITAIVTDADPAHTQEFRVRISFVVPDITLDSTQAIIADTLATYQDKTIVVKGVEGRLVPHVPVRLKNLIVLDGARVDTLATTTTIERRLELTVTNHLYVDCASSIDVTARGYMGAFQTNSDGSNTRNESPLGRTLGNTNEGGARVSGAAHGGFGDPRNSGATNAAYGSYLEPRTLGSGGGVAHDGGGAAAAGGGAAAILGGEASRFVIAGKIRADGGHGRSNQTAGAGAGGSVLLRAQDIILGPSGRVTANGGDEVAGGGGRIAIYATRTLTMPDNTVQARGGWNNGPNNNTTLDGGAGTIYIARPGVPEAEGDLYVSLYDDRHPVTNHQSHGTPLGTAGGSELVFRTINVGPKALLRFDSPYRATQENGVTVDASALLIGPDQQPLLTFDTTPAAGGTVWQNAPVALTYSASADDGIGEVRVILPGVADKVEDFNTFPVSVAPRTLNLNIPANATPGPIVLKIRAQTRGGRTIEQTATYTVVSDAAPLVQFDSVVPPAEVYAGGTVVVGASASDDLNVTSLTVESSAGSVSMQAMQKPNAQTATRQATVTLPKTQKSGTSVVLTLKASDGFPGRAPSTATHTLTIRKDEVNPNVTVTKPSAGQEINEATNATFTIEVQATDAEVGVESVKATFENVPYTLNPVSGQPGRYSVSGVPVPSVDGTEPVEKIVTVTVADYEPNTVIRTVPIYIVPLIDPNAPEMAWICGSSNAMYPAGASAPLRFTAKAPPQNPSNGVNRVEVSVNGGAPTVVTSANTEYTYNFTVPADAPAGTVFNVRAAAISQSGSQGVLLATITVVAGVDVTAARDIAVTDLSIENQTVIVRNGGVLTINGPHTLANLIVLDGGKVVQKHRDIGAADPLHVGALFIACNGSIDVSGLGFAKNTTYPGAGNPSDASGGSHIGRGGLWSQRYAGTFGSVYRPAEGGGGGQMMDPSYPAIAGGGSVRIHASSFVTIDGSIKSRVTDHFRLGSSAGGSVWITTPAALAGSGSIDVTGGSVTTSSGGAGAGGSIALEYATASGNIVKNLIAKGGTGSQGHHGGAGTVYLKSSAGTFGDLTIDNRNVSTTYGATELPSFGRVRAAGVNGANVTLENTRWLSPALAGHAVRVIAPDGTVRGTWKIASITNDATTRPVNGSHDVPAQDAVAYDGYIYYSAAGLGGRKFVAARYANNQWEYDNDSSFVAFTPQAGDGVIASFRKDAVSIVELTPYRCAPSCSTTSGVQVLELAGGEVVANSAGGGDGTNKWELGKRDNSELFVRPDGNARGIVVSKGVNASIALEAGADVQGGDVLRGVYRFDSVNIFNAKVTTEDLVEVTNPPSTDIFSTFTTGNPAEPVIDASKLTMINGLTGPVVSGSAGAVTDTNLPLHVISSSANAAPSAGVTWNASPSEAMVTATRGGASVRRPVTGHAEATGISSLNAIATSGFVSFSASQTDQQILVGLAPADTTNNYAEPQTNGFKLNTNAVYEVWANGANVNKNAPYNNATVFRVEKTPSAIRWFVNGAPVHELTTPIPASLLLDLSFQSATGGEIHSIEYDTTNAAAGRHRAAVAADGSFRVPAFGQPGESIVLRAIDGHAYPLVSNDVLTSMAAQLGIQSLTFAPAEATGGRTSTGTVTLQSPPGSDGARIVLASNNAAATVPSAVTIPSGQLSATFPVTTTPVANPVDVVITATYGAVSTNGALRIVKDNIQPAITINTPAANTQYNEGAATGIALEAVVIEEDSGLASVVATLNGVATNLTKNTARGPNVWTATLAVPFVDETAPVSKDIVVTATDNNANIGTATRTIVIKPVSDVNPPKLTANCLSSGAMYVIGDPASWRVTAEPPSATNSVRTVEFFVTDPNGVTTTHTATQAPNTNFWDLLYTVPPVADGATFQVRVLATTAGGATEEINTTFTAVADAVKINATTTIAATDTSYDNKSVVITAGTTTITGAHTFKRLIVLSGATVVHVTGGRVDVTASEGVFVACGGAIDTSGRGYTDNNTYPNETEPGGATGGSHIGRGGLYNGPYGTTYGSIYRPQEAGSAGGCCTSGPGGGVVRISAPSIAIDGAVRANGATGYDRSGAGGSVWITAARLNGNGAIEVNGGGPAYHGIGAGGAIAVEFTDPSSVLPKLHSRSGADRGESRYGGAGSVYVKGPSSTYGDLIIDNAGLNHQPTILPSLGSGTTQAGTTGATVVLDRAKNVQAFYAGHWLEIYAPNGTLKGTWRIDTIPAAKTIVLKPNAGETIDVQAGDKWQGVYRFDNMSANGIRVDSVDPIRIAGTQTIVGTVELERITTSKLVVRGTLTHATGQSLIITADEVVVEAGGSINASGRGFTSNNTYPNETESGGATGGSHIGRGGLYNGPYGTTYGSVYRPQEAGSAGGCCTSGPGGGVVRIIAPTVVVNGSILANGAAGYDRSGAGGSVWITTSRISSSGGVIQTNGGGPAYHGIGAGGAIAVEYTDPSSTLPAMQSRTGADRGESRYGGAGSIYVKGPGATYGDLTIDNGGPNNQPTILPSLGKGVTQAGTSGATVVLDRAKNVSAFYAGHWVEIYAPNGSLKGTWRIASIPAAKTIVLEPNGSDVPNVQQGDTWQGVYRFDNMKVTGVRFESGDPIRVGTQTLEGNVETERITAAKLVVNGMLTHATGQSLTITAGELVVATGGSINAGGRGYTDNNTYPGETEPGGATGGSHIGRGGLYNGPYATTYGSVYRPQEAGSAGGCCTSGPGGGIVRIIAPVVVINGSILANGATGYDRSGAGGSVWITASRITSSGGVIQTNGGGPAYHGIGAGGAIAIEYTDPSSSLPLLSSRTGTDRGESRYGGAGSIYVKGPSSIYGDLTINNEGLSQSPTILPSLGKGLAQAGTIGSTVVLDRAKNVQAFYAGHWVEIYSPNGTLKGTWRIESIPAAKTIVLEAGASVQQGDTWQGVYRFDNVKIVGVRFESADPVRAATQTLEGAVETERLGGDTIIVKGSLTHATGKTLVIEAAQEVRVESGASIDVTGRGYTDNNTYPNHTEAGGATGGSHIGRGGLYNSPFGSTYGSIYRPHELGGAGGCCSSGPGGGVVRISAPNVVVNGAIRANGATGYDRSGAGGSVWISSTRITGSSGVIETNGGGPAYHGIGGGGAIAVEYTDSSSAVPQLSSRSGLDRGESRYGGAGSIYVRGAGATYGNLIVDNKGINGQYTILPTLGSGSAVAGTSGAVVVTNKASNIHPYFAGHWVEILDAGGAVKGMWRIGSVSGKTMTLVPNGAESIDVQPGDGFQGVYRFDNVTLRTSRVVSGDPLRSTNPMDQGTTVLDINNGAPVFAASKRSQIVVTSVATGDSVSGPVNTVTDPSTPINLTVTNNRTAATFTAPANGDGSFNVPVTGAPGDTFTISATDSHTMPLTSQNVAVNGTIVETNRIASVVIRPQTVSGGTMTYATIQLVSPARPDGVVVTLGSSSPLAEVPASIRVTGGALTAQVPITTNSVSTRTDVTITATVVTSMAATLTLDPGTSALADLVISSSSVEGGTSVNGTVILGAPAPVGGAIVTLSSSSPAAEVPQSVVINEGETERTFTITTSRVGALTSSMISAAYGSSAAEQLELTACAAMNAVTPPASMSMKTMWVDDAIPAGATQSGTATFDATQSASGTTAVHFTPAAAGTVTSFAFTGAPALAITPNENLVFHLLVNPCNPPREVKLSWTDGTTTWHTSWGESRIEAALTPRLRVSAVPNGGEWLRMEVLAKDAGITTNKNLTGVNVRVDGGEAWVDAIGIASCSIPRLPAPQFAGTERVWFDDTIPPGAIAGSTYSWDTTQAASGNVSDVVTGTGLREHWFDRDPNGFQVRRGDVFFTYVLIDPCNPPREIALQWWDGSGWERRAFWGEDLIGGGSTQTQSHWKIGLLPASGEWVRLEVPASVMGLEDKTVYGFNVRIFDGRAWFDRVGAYSRVNVARGKEATQVANYTDEHHAARAVDGILEGDPHFAAITASQATPYWTVDLGSVQPIEDIVVWNQTNASANRLSNYRVYVSDVPFTSTTVAGTTAQAGVSTYAVVGTAARTNTFRANRNGRYVRVQLAGTNFLQLAEVEVWAPAARMRMNLAGGRPATSSTTFDSTTLPSAGVDTHLNDHHQNRASIFHTLGGSLTNQYFEVDLGSVQPIATIERIRRIDGFDSIDDHWLLVSDVPFTSNVLATSMTQPGVSAYYFPDNTHKHIPINRTGRYVRMQKATASFGFAEFRVWSHSLLLGTLARPADSRSR
jgi:Bacterial Ig-like domain/Carboxypeptidase regulatory-like domain/F5/8 type C domain